MLRALIVDGVTGLSRHEWAASHAIWTDIRAIGGLEHLCDVVLLGLALRLGRAQAADAAAAYYQRFAPDDPYLSQVRSEARSLLELQEAARDLSFALEDHDLQGWSVLGRRLWETRALDAAAAVWEHLASDDATQVEAWRRLIRIEECRGNWTALTAIATRPGFVPDAESGRALERAEKLLGDPPETKEHLLKRFFASPGFALLTRLSEQPSALQPRVVNELCAFESELASASADVAARPADRRDASIGTAGVALSARVRNLAVPSVAVVIATRDRPGFLRRCLQSVVEQCEPADEVIVADDGSTDDLAAIRSDFSALLPLVWIRQDHAGVAAARNLAVDRTRSTWTCVMDDDDIMLPNRLRDHRRSLVDPMTAVSHGGWVNFDVEGSQATFLAGKNLNVDVFFHAGLALTHGASMIRTDLIRAHRYDETLSAGVDFDFFTRLVRAGERFAHTRSYVLLRRLHRNRIGATSTSRTLQQGVRASNIAQRLDETGMAAREEEIKKRARSIPMVPIVDADLSLIGTTTGIGFRELRITIKRKVDQARDAVLEIARLAPQTYAVDDENAESRVTLCIPYESCRETVRERLLAIAATEGRPYSFAVPEGAPRTVSLTMRLPKNKDIGLRLRAPGLGPLLSALEGSDLMDRAWVLNLEQGQTLADADAAPYRNREDVARAEATCRTLTVVEISLLAM